MSEVGVQMVVRQRAINAGLQPRCEEMLVKELERVGCTDIYFQEPEWRRFSPEPEWENQWEPYWAWEFVAIGERVGELAKVDERPDWRTLEELEKELRA